MPRLLLLVLSSALTAAAVSVGVLRSPPPAAPPVAVTAATARPEPAAAALAVLRTWDERRAAAWAAGDAAALEELYVPGSASGARDVRMLRRWTARGLRVRGLEVQVLQARVRSVDRDRLLLLVTDRVTGARAVGDGTDVPLPVDGPTAHAVTLVRSAGEWRVAEVR